MYIYKKRLKHLLTCFLIVCVMAENAYMPKCNVLAITNTIESSNIIELNEKDTDIIGHLGAIDNPGSENIKNPMRNSVFSFEKFPKQYGNTAKPVYNQGGAETCWAFAGTSLFEYTVDHKMNVSNTSLSVEHLVEKTSYVGGCGFTPKSKEGGNSAMCAAYFVSGYGPVPANDYPWEDDVKLNPDYDFGEAEYRATDIRYIEAERNDDGTLNSDTNDIVKEAIYNNGAVYCTIYSDRQTQSTNSKYLGSDNVSYYVSQRTDINHAVLIIGWDDTWSKSKFKTKPKSDGAWLVRNSWGAHAGDKGYYWVSYEDLSIKPEITICDYEEMRASEKVYNLDESGRHGDYPRSPSAKEEGYINVFDIENNEKITAVTFFVPSPTAKYQIYYIPIKNDGTPDVLRKVAVSNEESVPYAGYHTVLVNQEIEMSPGAKCGIMIYIKDEKAQIGCEYLAPKTTKTLNEGESFIYDSSGSIIDLRSLNDMFYGNFSIKLVTEQYDVPISACEVESISNRRYNGNKKKPTPEITYNGIALTQGKDYTLSYENNVYAGTATVIITGIGNYTGTRRVNFTILKAKISECTVAAITDKRYNGNHKTPTPEITYNGMTLVQGTDYTMSYANNVNAGTATATITGIGNYQGTRTVNYTIKKAKFAEAVISDIDIQYYTGTEIHPTYTVTFNNNKLTLQENVDYTVSYVNCTNAGTATLKLTGKGNYSGTKSVNFTISPASMSGANIYGIVETYTGSEIIHKQTIKYNEMILTEGIDYTVSYADNINAGMGLTKITGINNFTGTRNVRFYINPADISKATISSINMQGYSGSPETPKPTITFNNMTLNEGIDYTLSYSNNVEVGIATITITGIGNFTGTTTKTFEISNHLLCAKIWLPKVTYDEKNGALFIQNEVITMGTKTLVKDVDYLVEIKPRIIDHCGSYDIYFTGIGEYTGIIIFGLNVVPANSTNNALFSNQETGIEFHQIQKPTIEIDGKVLIEGVDYDAYFVGNIYVETSLDTIAEINNFNTIQPDVFDISSDETVEIFE